MKFSDLLNRYMKELPCSARELAARSGLSESSISRYRSGSRVPVRGSEELDSIIKALEDVAREQGKEQDEAGDTIRESLENLVPDRSIDRERYGQRLSALLDALEVSRAKLSARLAYDASFLSRILSGERAPSDYRAFSEQIAEILEDGASSVAQREKLAGLLGISSDRIREEKQCRKAIYEYLMEMEATDGGEGSSEDATREAVHNFLLKLDEFDLNDYMKRIHFDRIPALKSPFHAENTKQYVGLEGIKRAELDFLRKTVLSTSTEPVWQFSDFPMAEMAADMAFSKKWMMGLAMTLKKGLQINIIHDLDRPFEEMMLGLESWIPLYMTGLINPYYLRELPEKAYSHLFRMSGSCVLVGECPGQNLAGAMVILSSREEERKAAEIHRKHLFDRALPLMEIYRDDRKKEYEALVREEEQKLRAECGEDAKPRILAGEENEYFKNIRIVAYGDRCVMVIKENDPYIRFVIRHPKLVSALLAM